MVIGYKVLSVLWSNFGPNLWSQIEIYTIDYVLEIWSFLIYCQFLPGPTSRTIYMEPSVIVHWVPLIWSSDIRSFRCYGQFYAGPICQWLLSKIYWKDGHSGFMVKFCLVPPWNIYPESSVLHSSPLWHLCPAHYSLPRPASPSAVVGVSYLHPHLLARSD